MLTQPSLTLARRLNASPAKVFAAWTDPEKIIHWFGPSQTIVGSVKAEMDVRVGGGFRISFNTDDGDYHQVGGKYREVVRDQRLVFSWAWHSTPERESVVTVTIKPDGNGSLLTLNHGQFFDQAAADGHKRGWTGTLDKLEKMFA
ncbi:SRPBCC domain-containing protein [Bradyrhizobium prioriisuperbiae]|uniref:SRPBCC family protein n=1 Tax=Bradyrhizobium prioriisuperbiae TaxID=2854389 RepID=UPI0028EE8251|nr:SRPBCC domain-containing protein [Bradyrhizobium prioritasuperba]